MKTQDSIELKALFETASEQPPVVKLLLSVIETLTAQLEQQGKQLSTQSEKIELLLSEMRRLKKLPEKPKFRASTLPKNKDDDFPNGSKTSSSSQRAGSAKRSKNKTLTIDKEEIITLENVPANAVHKGYHNYVVQELVIKPQVINYRLERWQLSDASYVVASLPNGVKGHHFGPTLRAYILHQHHHQCVTQPLLRAQLREWNIDISAGQLSRLLTEDKESFHAEKSALLTCGLRISKYIQVDDTGAQHQGSNGFCTFIGNELFSWFESTSNKNRINFLTLLRHGYDDYQITEASFIYMKRHHVAPWIRNALREANEKIFENKITFENYLLSQKITNAYYKRLVTEAALIGSILAHGFLTDTVILSDDAGQFNVFMHALCWIHAERGIKSLLPCNDIQAKAVEWARNEIWEIYSALCDYKNQPDKQLATGIETRFDTLCKTKTDYCTLNLALKRLFKNKDELLLVLKRPDIPLHNNLSERDIREYVKRRKISGSTRRDEGRRCRDTFASLKKTALKMKVGFWNYLIDRLSMKGDIPPLDKLVLEAAS